MTVTHDEARAAISKAKTAAITEGGKPTLAEMVEWLDETLAQQEQSARAWVLAGQPAPGAEWARKLQVGESLLRFLKLVQSQEKDVAKVLAPRRAAKG